MKFCTEVQVIFHTFTWGAQCQNLGGKMYNEAIVDSQHLPTETQESKTKNAIELFIVGLDGVYINFHIGLMCPSSP